MNDEAQSELKSIIDMIDEEDQALIADIPNENEAIMLHRSVGMWIRNQIRKGKFPNLLQWSQVHVGTKGKSLDDQSWPIVIEVWKALKFSPEYKKIQSLHPDPNDVALKKLRKRAEEGHADAQYFLGTRYFSGSDGIKQDFIEALRWIRNAAEQDFRVAQCALASMYEKGQGLEKDYAEAYFWWSLGTNQANTGVEKRDNNRGRIKAFLTADQIGTADKKIVEWYRKAAENGDARSQADLGRLYVRGEHVKQDYVEAIFWKTLAQKGGVSMWDEGDAEFYKKYLDAKKKAAVEKRVEEWLNVHPIVSPITNKN